MYGVRGEGYMREVEELVMHLIMTYGYNHPVAEAKSVTYRKLLREAIAFLKKVRGGSIVIFPQKITTFRSF